MVFKRFRLVILARVLLLSATIYLLLHLIFNFETHLYATILIVAIILLYQIYRLIHYVEKTNRDLNRFLLTIKYEDFSQTFSGRGLGSSFDELKQAFNEIIQKFQQTRSEKEEHFRYLQTVVQHVGIGLIAFRTDGKVELFNTAAKKILRMTSLKNIHDLSTLSKSLVEKLVNLKSGQNALVKVHSDNEILQLAINTTEFRLRDQSYTLLSLQNIQSELEEQELDAWQKLIRVLTHEIMNSVTPIASLASTLNKLVNPKAEEEKNKFVPLSTDAREDLQGGLETIQKRSEGLLHFVDAYRNLTRVPAPNLRIFSVKELFDNLTNLMTEEAKPGTVEISSQAQPGNLELLADPELVEQILINIIKNAIQAFADNSGNRIDLGAHIDNRGRVVISVADNGPGITRDLQDKIFIPFFTTKEEGSGIGLSLSRQIMRLHRGTIGVFSKPGEGSVFTLRF